MRALVALALAVLLYSDVTAIPSPGFLRVASNLAVITALVISAAVQADRGAHDARGAR